MEQLKKKEIDLSTLHLSHDDAAAHACCDHGHDHVHEKGNHSGWNPYFLAGISLVMLLVGIVLDHISLTFFQGILRFAWYALAYGLVTWKVAKQAFYAFKKKEVFNEFFLMGIATLGAFFLGEYPEGVTVMLFYVIGEHFQDAAVMRSRRSIKDLIDNRPEEVTLAKENRYVKVDPKSVKIGDVVQVKAGEKVALDGELRSDYASFNASALTGESQPVTKTKGEKVFAGMLNLDKVIELDVTAVYENSALSGILKLVERATARKAKPQQFISKFAKIYTPIVVFLALSLALVPYFFVPDYVFHDWLYRALVFLVVSCPCALVISIPLGYFGGIGAASRQGILFKGSSYLDDITKVDAIVLDKTGTLTKGRFKVQEIKATYFDQDKLLAWTAALENASTHPIAKAIASHAKGTFESIHVTDIEEISGYGLKGKIEGSTVLAGNTQLLTNNQITYDKEIENIPFAVVAVAIDSRYAGYFVVVDELKEDAQPAVQQLRRMGIKEIILLSGDKQKVAEAVAQQVGIDRYFGELLPEDKVKKVEELKRQGKKVAFVGDGINDAPVIASADVGIAMGGLGSDAAIETADIVIQNDQPSKLAIAIRIGKATRSVVWQNIGLSFLVKVLVLALGASGVATLWEAVFADVGVAFLAILNAIRIQGKKWNE